MYSRFAGQYQTLAGHVIDMLSTDFFQEKNVYWGPVV